MESNPVGGMSVYASSGEKLGHVSRTDSRGLLLQRASGGEIHIDRRALKRVTKRGVELWLAKAELRVPGKTIH